MGMGGFPQATCVDTDLTNTPVRRQEAPGSGGCLSRRSSRGAGLLTEDWAPLLRAASSVGRGWCQQSPENTSSREGDGTEVFLLLEMFLQHLLPRLDQDRVKGFRSQPTKGHHWDVVGLPPKAKACRAPQLALLHTSYG